jgi:hypothetical protein
MSLCFVSWRWQGLFLRHKINRQLTSRPDVLKLFTTVIDECSLNKSVILGRPFQLNLMFVGKNKNGSLRLLAIPINIRLGFKSLPGTNTVVKTSVNYGHKKFTTFGPPLVHKLEDYFLAPQTHQFYLFIRWVVSYQTGGQFRH